MNKTGKPRWLQFSMRFLLLVMLICAVASAVFLRPPSANVSGLATVNGQPLSGATIEFVGKSGEKTQIKTDKNGQYRLHLKSGEYAVAVQSPLLPKTFALAQSSGIVVFVGEGENNVAIDLAAD